MANSQPASRFKPFLSPQNNTPMNERISADELQLITDKLSCASYFALKQTSSFFSKVQTDTKCERKKRNVINAFNKLTSIKTIDDTFVSDLENEYFRLSGLSGWRDRSLLRKEQLTKVVLGEMRDKLNNVTGIHLGHNNAIEALSLAIASGSLGKLELLDLDHNNIGNTGMKTLCEAISSGALANLKALGLEHNNIGDAGLTAFAGAIGASGALASLKTLYVDDGPLGTEHPALKAACQERGIRLPQGRWVI